MKRLTQYLARSVAALVLLVPGCTAVVALESRPCAADFECAQAFPGESTVCDLDRGFCTAPEGLGTPCGTHFECNQSEALDGDELCIAGRCQRVLGEMPGGGSCLELVGEITDDPLDTVVVPQIVCRSGPESFGPAFAGSQLAVKDVNANGGLAGGRRMLLLSCDPGADAEAATGLARFALDTLQSPLVSGPTNANLAFVANEEVFVEDGTVVVTMNPDAGISALRPDGRVFRTFAGDRAIVEAAANLISRRYNGERVQVLASSSTDVTRRWADAFGAAAQAAGLVVKRRDYDFDPGTQDPSSLREAARQLKVADGFPPDFLVLASNIEVSAAVAAYALAFGGTFPEQTRLIIDSYGFFGLPDFAATYPELLARTDLPLPDFSPGEAFVGRMGASFNITDRSVLTQAGLLFDITMLAALAHSRSVDVASADDIAGVIRDGLSGGVGAPMDIASDGSAFGTARQTLGAGDAIQYILAGGQTVLMHDAAGEMTSSRFGSLTIGPDLSLVPRRAVIGGDWIDVCNPELPDPCGPWNDADNAPPQTCIDLDMDGPFPPLCLPECAEAACPVFSCHPELLLCAPPPS